MGDFAGSGGTLYQRESSEVLKDRKDSRMTNNNNLIGIGLALFAVMVTIATLSA